MPEKTLRVTLVAASPAPETLCALAARLCYAKVDIDQLLTRVNSQDQAEFLDKITQSGHLSVLEHAAFTFAVEGVSRVLLAQLTRHRIASFSVQSQRYVSLADDFAYIVPPAIKALGEDARRDYAAQMAQMQAWYVEWQQKLGAKGESSNEDARFVLPGACETRLMLTMNARELLHFFQLRCCTRAQWEIRALADEMLRLCKGAAPALFAAAGPGCVGGQCPEGGKSCGQAARVRARYRAMTQ